MVHEKQGNPRTCKATTTAGSACSAQPVRPDGFCYWHSPALATERAAARRRGGEHRSNRLRAAKLLPAALTSDDLLVTLSRVIHAAERGSVEPGVVTCISGAARTMTEIRKTTEIEQRLADLEARAGIGNNDRRFG